MKADLRGEKKVGAFLCFEKGRLDFDKQKPQKPQNLTCNCCWHQKPGGKTRWTPRRRSGILAVSRWEIFGHFDWALLKHDMTMTCQLQQKKMQQKINKGNRCRCMDRSCGCAWGCACGCGCSRRRCSSSSSPFFFPFSYSELIAQHAQARQRRQRSKNRTSTSIHRLSCYVAVAICRCRVLASQEEKNENMEEIEFWPATVRITPESAVAAVFYQSKFARYFFTFESL